MLRGRFVATPIQQASSASLQGRAQGLGSLFQSHVIQPQMARFFPKKREENEPSSREQTEKNDTDS